MTIVQITKIPLLNSVVIKQKNGHFFISTSDSFIIDKDGLLQLIVELGKIGFIEPIDLVSVINTLSPIPQGKEDS